MRPLHDRSSAEIPSGWSGADTEPVTDIVTFGPDKSPRRISRRLVVTGVVALSIGGIGVAVVSASGDSRRPAAVVSASGDGRRPAAVAPTTMAEPAPAPDGPPCRPVGWAQSPASADAPAGVIIDGSTDQGYGLVRCDRGAVDGPWAAVVRRKGGSLGRGGAVVTFPVPAPSAGRHVEVRGAAGTAQPGAVTWQVAGAHARVRGDLPESDLIAIAAGTTVSAGRPAVRAPTGYRLVSIGPYRPPAIHEIRYGSGDLGEQAALGNGLTYTGVANGGGFEDQLYAMRTADGGLVRGHRAVVSSVFGGNATLAWEPAAGIVAYVGYSGAQLDDTTIAALRRLAGRARTLGASQWQTIDHQTADQTNDPG